MKIELAYVINICQTGTYHKETIPHYLNVLFPLLNDCENILSVHI